MNKEHMQMKSLNLSIIVPLQDVDEIGTSAK